MTIDEAIIHCEEVATRKLKNENNAKCVQCGEEHVQLAKWLKELKDYKSREDVVPVVRCRDCKHVYCRIYHGWQEPIYTCTHLRSRWNTDNDLEVNPDDFCSYGKRKE